MSRHDVAALLRAVEDAPGSGPNFRRSQEVFAIRDLLGEVPGLWPLLDTAALRQLLAGLFPAGCQLVKAIYFDKPAGSNWLVAVAPGPDDKREPACRYARLRPMDQQGRRCCRCSRRMPVLKKVVTLRLHLDDCDSSIGALKVVFGSNRRGVVPVAAIATLTPGATVCEVPAVGAMLHEACWCCTLGTAAPATGRAG